MTRHADPDTRRLQIAEALLSTLSERGLGGTTLADVAAAADVSVGLVQRYFRTKEELLIFGIEYVYQRATDRLHQVEVVPPVRDVVVGLMETFLPLDETRERELRVWLNFLTASLTSRRMAAIHQAATSELIDGITDALTAAQRTGELDGDLDPRTEAAAFVAFVDGLCLHHAATGDGYDATALREALVTYAERLFKRGAA
ncbi:TetR family transcriptional regulator [Spongiactinospora rosea]|uniref:TetR family transcriptional regulator n=1 Tax=Spongiactinospora rosea TaxID=2248750 RepID=A0A366M5P9_9ACTN|nr:TetR family transcriptional regulator C-terminal domain-containing protein [Spongiactinospora rosea]RBQ20762.1 TetR family transcriptional regulator [Spongiactinospora rosea]